MNENLTVDKHWFVIHTYSGYENKVKANLERRVESMGMEDKIFRIIVPMEEVVDYKDGKKTVAQKKIFPGYVLVEMVVTDDSWYVVRNTPGVTGFVGSGVKPIPLEDDEVSAILQAMGFEDPRPRVNYSVGETVKVIAGPFVNFSGEVEDINLDKKKLTVKVSMFGRETPVELDFDQIAKL